MKAVELVETLRAYPLFSTKDLSRILRKNEDYVKVVAYRLRKRGVIRHVERGKYTVHDDPREFASYIRTPSYISFWTALSMHKLTEQVPIEIMVAVPRPKKSMDFGGQRITFTKVSQFWGYAKIRLGLFDIFVAEKEKAVIDCMLAKNTPFDEAAKAILSGELDYEKLVEYVKRTGKMSLAKRVGYLTEKAGAQANGLLDMVGRLYTPLNWSSETPMGRDSRWKIIVNTRLDDL